VSDDVEHWIATLDDGREVPVAVQAIGGMSTHHRAACEVPGWEAREATGPTPGVALARMAFELSVHATPPAPVVELRRAGEPSRAELLATIARHVAPVTVATEVRFSPAGEAARAAVVARQRAAPFDEIVTLSAASVRAVVWRARDLTAALAGFTLRVMLRPEGTWTWSAGEEWDRDRVRGGQGAALDAATAMASAEACARAEARG
jgi:hypothetical protein